MPVVVYTGPGCSACKQAKQFLTLHGVEYVEKNIGDDPVARDELIAMGYRAVPVIKIGDETMLGFSAPRLRRMLNL